MKKGNNFTFNIIITLVIMMTVSIVCFTGCGGGGADGVIPSIQPTPTENVITQGFKYLGINTTPNIFAVGLDVTNGSSEFFSGDAVHYTAPIGANGFGSMKINKEVQVIDLYFFTDEQTYQNSIQNNIRAMYWKPGINIGTEDNPSVTIVIPNNPDPNDPPVPTIPPPEPTNTPTPIPTVTPGPTNLAPYAPSNLAPSDGATNQPLSVELSAYYNDPEGSPGTISFYEAVSGQLIGTANVNHGQKATVTWAGLSYSTTYAWYAVANDGEDNSPFSSTFDFTTRDEPVDPTPIPSIPNIVNKKPGGVSYDIDSLTGTDLHKVINILFHNGTTWVNANIENQTSTEIQYTIPYDEFSKNANLVQSKVTYDGGEIIFDNCLVMSQFDPSGPYYDTTTDGYTSGDIVVIPDNSANPTSYDAFITATDGDQRMIYGYDVGQSLTGKRNSQQYGSAPSSLTYSYTTNKLYSHYRTGAFSINTDFSNSTDFNTTKLNQSGGLCINPLNNNILFADLGQIEKFMLNGTYINYFTWKYSTPNMIAADSKGNIYINDNNNHKVTKYNSDENFVTEWNRYIPRGMHVYEIDGIVLLASISSIQSGPDIGKSVLIVEDVTNANPIILVKYIFDGGEAVGEIYIYSNPNLSTDSFNGSVFYTCGNGNILVNQI